jgi:hypothetical protein
MKQILKFWSLATLVVLSVGFSSCDKDDDEGGSYKGYGYLEVTVNGKTYKYNDVVNIQAGVTGQKLFFRAIGDIETPDVDLYFSLYYYVNDRDFKNTKAGDFRIGDDFNTPNNFDLSIDLYNDGDGWYNYVSGGKHTVSSVKLLSTDKNTGDLIYLVEGTFSCSFKHNTSGKTLEMSGKYWTKLEVNPESKL